MPLTDEQRSMLQLLLGGQSYEDIASLLGVSTDEVRSRARGALQEIGRADPDTQVALSDFLLGQADPIGRADAVRHLQSDPQANALAANLVTQLRLLAPQAELPEIPPARGGRAAAAPAPAAPAPMPVPPTGPPGSAPVPAPPPPAQPGAARSFLTRIRGVFAGLGSDKRRAQLLIGLGAFALLIVVGVLAIVGVFDGDDDSGSSSAEQTSSVPSDANLTVVRLAPLSGDSQATGQAVFAQTGDQPLLQINLSGLPQAPSDQTYIVWLYNSDQAAFPLARDQVGEAGNLTGAAPIPQELLPLLSQFGCVDVSLASNRQTQQALQQAVEGQTLPAHSGESVMRGQVPANPGEQAPSGADSQCQGTPPPQGAGGAGGGAGGDEGAGTGDLGQ